MGACRVIYTFPLQKYIIVNIFHFDNILLKVKFEQKCCGITLFMNMNVKPMVEIKKT